VYHVISCRGAALIGARERKRRRRLEERRGEAMEDGTGMGWEPTAIGNWPDDID